MTSKMAIASSKSGELPNKSEQLSLKNAEILSKSNLVRMQLSELLTNVRASETSSKHNKISKWLEELTEALKACDSKLINSDFSGKGLKEKGLAGFNLEGFASDSVSINFQKPESVQTIGSFALGTATSPILNCDIAVVMPKSCFDARDILNQVYFNKRKLYLAAISEVLNSAGLCSSIQLSHFKADHRKPFLIVKPNFKTKYLVRLYPCAPTGVFKLVQLLSSKNNVRPDAWMRELQARSLQGKTNGKNQSKINSELDPASLAATPHYNMAILEDLSIIPQSRMLLKASQSCPCFKDVCILLKVWLAQKNIRFGINDLDGHSIQIIVAYLFQTRRIGQQTAALGAFQIVLGFLVETSFSSVQLQFVGEKSEIKDSIWAAILCHPVGKDSGDIQFNALWRVSSSAIQDLQNESKIALSMLQLETEISFYRIFLEKRQFFSRYDLIFHIPLNSFKSSIEEALSIQNDSKNSKKRKTESATSDSLGEMGEGDVVSLDMTVPQYLCSKALTVARRALSNRIKSVSSVVRERDVNESDSDLAVKGTSTTSWDRYSQPKDTSDTCVITLGVVLDNEHAHRRVDKGAEMSEDNDAAEVEKSVTENFSSFWGRKSELRRFKDGTIVDAVVWGEKDMPSMPATISSSGVKQGKGGEMKSAASLREFTGEALVESIVRYSLGMHLPHCAGANGECITSLEGLLEGSLPGSTYSQSNSEVALQGSAPRLRYLHAVEALDRLRSILTSEIKDLPLVFESITGSQPSLRYTSMLPPMPHPLLLNAKDKLKGYSGVALSLIAQPMLVIGQVEGGGKWPSEPEAIKKVKTALLLRAGYLLRVQFEVPSQPSNEHLDIFYKGYIFRLVIFFSTETTTNPMTRLLQSSSLHHQSIRALHTQHSDSFSACVRLLNLWLSKHFFSGFLSQKQIELLAAAVYLDPTSLCSPTTSASALFRVLDMLGKHDFDLAPLLVTFGEDEVKGQVKSRAAQMFQAFQASPRFSSTSLLVLSSDDFKNFDDFPVELTIERVLLSAIQGCAKDSAVKLMRGVLGEEDLINSDIFRKSNLLEDQCNLVLQFNSSIQCKTSGGTGYLEGPKYASLKVYANTVVQPHSNPEKLIFGNPTTNSANVIQEEIVTKLRKEFQDVALFFWDDTVGDKLGVTFKPSSFVLSAFSPTSTRHKISIFDGSKGSPMLNDVSQIAMTIFAKGNGCFSDINIR